MMQRKAVAIQMDPPESINPRTDTTLLLAAEATRRGYEVYHYAPDSLTLNNGELVAHGRSIVFQADAAQYFSAGEWQTIALQRMQVVLMRQDPPFDMKYLTATYLLETLMPDVLVVNHPTAVRNAPEKLSILRFAEWLPPTLITRDTQQIKHFLAEQGEIVIKPLYGYAGHGVFRLTAQDTNMHALLEMVLSQSQEPWMVQKYLSEIRTMDKRIIVIDGKITVIMGRVPASDDIRANFRAGGHGVAVKPSARDIAIGETVGSWLAERGIVLAGLDVIGDYLTEINVTSPTGLPKSNALYGLKQEALFWDAVESRLK